MNLYDYIKSFLFHPEVVDITLERSLLFDRYGKPVDESLELAVAAVLFLAAHSDSKVLNLEVEYVTHLLEREFGHRVSGVRALAKEGLAVARDQARILKFIHVLTTHFDIEQRVALLSLVWRVLSEDEKVVEEEYMFLKWLAERLGLTDVHIVQAQEMRRE